MANQSIKQLFRCIIMGPPGSGKGTVAERIVTNFDILHFPSGDYLRREIRERTDKGKEAKKYIEKGQLVPDELITKIMIDELNRHPNSNWLIDGFPRTVKQAQILQKNCQINSVIELNVPFEIIIDRLKDRWIHAASGRVYNLGFNAPKVPGKDDVTGEPLIQRVDDRPETVASRLNGYKTWEEPVANFYKQQNILKQFSGKATNEIWPHVLKYLQEKIPNQYHLKNRL